MKLLNPGPVTLSARVRAAMNAPDTCHREKDFAELVARVLARLGRVYEAPGFVPVMLTGSGTAAVEAMLSSLVPRGARVLVVANGVYGERAAQMLAARGDYEATVLRAEWTAPMRSEEAAAAIARGEATHVFAVHHETTTGRLNDLAPIGAACAKAGVPLLLDTVSSFGAEAIDLEGWNVLACAATANKCLHGAPGVAFVLARESAFARPSAARSVYLDLHRYRSDLVPFTPCVPAVFALDAALVEMDEAGGWRARRDLYAARSKKVRDGMRALGVQLLLESPSASASMMTAFKLPAGARYDALHDHLKQAGFVIYAGQGKFDGAIFRIAVMGELCEDDLDRLLEEAARALR